MLLLLSKTRRRRSISHWQRTIPKSWNPVIPEYSVVLADSSATMAALPLQTVASWVVLGIRLEYFSCETLHLHLLICCCYAHRTFSVLSPQLLQHQVTWNLILFIREGIPSFSFLREARVLFDVVTIRRSVSEHFFLEICNFFLEIIRMSTEIFLRVLRSK